MSSIEPYALRGAAEAVLNQNQDKPGVKEVGKGFHQLLEGLVGGANRMQHEAGAAVDGLLKGEITDIHQVMVAVNKAELSFKFLVEVRNKLTEAYRELMTAK